MKKSLKTLILLILILIVISIGNILLFGRTYEVKFIISDNNNFEFSLDNDSGAVEILEQRQENNKYIVKVKALKPGSAYLSINYGVLAEGKRLYVHKSLVITDGNFLGKSTGSEIIPISISVVLIYMLYILIKKYRNCVKDNIYQYKNVFYLGFIIFMLLFTFSNGLSTFNYQGLYTTINNIINSMLFVSYIIFPAAVVTFILVTISNLHLIRKEGKSFKNLLGLFLGIFLCLSTLLPDYVYELLQKSRTINVFDLDSIGPYLYNFVEAIVYLVITYLECILIGTIIISLKSALRKIKYNKDYIIILGCQIRKDGTLTPLLKGRVDRAIRFRNEQLNKTGKDLVFITSGGKGTDEIISEAEAMKNYLLEKGIDEKNILMDVKSKNTYENIKFSYKLIKDKDANICFSTTNYHVFRVGLIATKQNLKLEGIGSNTKPYFWINAFIREFIGTLYSERKKHIVVFVSIVLIILVMIIVSYLANNL